MAAEVISITANLDVAWAHYLACKQRAEVTGTIDDGIKAGRAWRRWLDLFMTEDQRRACGGAR